MKTQSVWTRIQMLPIYLCVLLVLCSPVAASGSPDAWGKSDISTYNEVTNVITHGVHWLGDKVANGIASIVSWWEQG